MYIHVNERNEIKEVGNNSNPSLACLQINDNDIDNPFLYWNTAKICCYKVKVSDGVVTEYTPYVDTRIIEHIDRQGKANIDLQSKVDYLSMMTDIEI